MHIHDVMDEAIRRQASDVMISAGAPIAYNVFGVLENSRNFPVMTGEVTRELVLQMLNDKQKRQLDETWELDMGYELQGRSRFRVSAYWQRGTVACVMRLIPLKIPHYSEIGISDRLLMQLISVPNGLMLFTGPTGAGKSTTIASMLDYMNTEGDVAKHIVTIEDPIEYFLPTKICHTDQREIGIDTKGYLPGLRSALRQMPHVIFVGEMRDRETMEIALTASETGNYVISTMATQSASKTINRIVDVFPLHDQAEVRARLALSLRGVISQVLLRRKDKAGRIAAREVLFVTNSVSNLIREGKIHQIDNVIASSYAEGMCLMDDSLIELHDEGLIYTADVVARLRDPDKARGLARR